MKRFIFRCPHSPLSLALLRSAFKKTMTFMLALPFRFPPIRGVCELEILSNSRRPPKPMGWMIELEIPSNSRGDLRGAVPPLIIPAKHPPL